MPQPLRIVLANLCETSYGYGSGASEYLRAALLQTPELRDQVLVEVVFLQSVAVDDAAAAILAHQPDLIGFTVYSWNLADTGEVSRAIRLLDDSVPITWGGCSFLHFRQRHDWFTWWDAVDAVAVGEGEQTLIDLLLRLRIRQGRATVATVAPGWVVYDQGVVRVGPPALPVDILSYASPYQLGIATRVPRPYVEMARGCVFDCAFCSDAKGSRGKLVYHLADRVAADVATIVQWPEAEWVDAGASTANASEESFWAVCDGIRRGDPQQRLVYSFQLYPALVRPSHRDALRGIRIGKHLIGLQSIAKAAFAPMRRSGTLDQLRRAIDILQETGPVSVSVIMGLPGETYESFAQMMAALVEIPGLHISVHRLLVLPGTDFHTRHEALGLGVDGSRFYRATRSSTMTEADFVRAQELVIEHAIREGKSQQGRQRVDWTNFDAQLTPFAPPTPPRQL